MSWFESMSAAQRRRERHRRAAMAFLVRYWGLGALERVALPLEEEEDEDDEAL